jgi:hypothetical protein
MKKRARRAKSRTKGTRPQGPIPSGETTAGAKSKRRGTFLEFFQNSPLKGSGVVIERIKGRLRPL